MDSRVKTFVAEQIGQRSKGAGRQILATANTLRSIAGQLRSDQLSRGGADLVDNGAAKAEEFGRYLSETDFSAIFADAQDYGRRRPWIVVAGGLAIGLSASRLVKAAAAHRDYLNAQIRVNAHSVAPEPAGSVGAPASSGGAQRTGLIAESQSIGGVRAPR